MCPQNNQQPLALYGGKWHYHIIIQMIMLLWVLTQMLMQVASSSTKQNWHLFYIFVLSHLLELL